MIGDGHDALLSAKYAGSGVVGRAVLTSLWADAPVAVDAVIHWFERAAQSRVVGG